ncbi:leucine-rich repeat extensin-like protein 6 [Notothenia coriiceps]|uniref:Leucine-rich repeat extensin-like protein 6 n=1 Tax=Notothenia coriiceps TaxID=8208 RepID=A0A6I9P8Q8_9TELE|nr:PREDICTED: leucine-rich repeat extensin-like protein 6 [Notothenia coriiceps]
MRPQPITLAELREAMGFGGEAPPPPPPPPPPRPPPPPAPAPPPVMSSAISVDAKADLTSLLNEWEESQRGTTETLVSILTR